MTMHEHHVMFNTQWVWDKLHIQKHIAISTVKCLCVHMECNENGEHRSDFVEEYICITLMKGLNRS